MRMMGVEIWVCTKRWKSKPQVKAVSTLHDHYLYFKWLMFEVDVSYISEKSLVPYIKLVFGFNKKPNHHNKHL